MAENKKENEKYTYNWIWFILMTLWVGMEAYWTGLSLERKFSYNVTLPMITISAMIGLGFLIAFINSKERRKEIK